MRQLLPLFLVASAFGSPLEKRVSGTSVVNLGNNTGSPEHLASGILYGIPDTPDQIPQNLYEDMGFNYARAGGAQVAAPGRGWIWGLTEYKVCRWLACTQKTCSMGRRIDLLLPCQITRPREHTMQTSSFLSMICGALMGRKTPLLRIPAMMGIVSYPEGKAMTPRVFSGHLSPLGLYTSAWSLPAI